MNRVATVNLLGATICLEPLNFDSPEISRSDGGWYTILNGKYTLCILSGEQILHNIGHHKFYNHLHRMYDGVTNTRSQWRI